MVRSLYSTYVGRLYELKRFGDNATLDIAALGPGGFADAQSHARFCAGDPSPPSGLPALGTVVKLEPVNMPNYALRHCYSQAFVTTTVDSGEDHRFTLVAALSGTKGAVSLQSVNFPTHYLALMPGDTGRAGIVPSPAVLDASWAVTAAVGGGFTFTSLSPSLSGPTDLTVGGNLTGACAHSYSPPAASVYLTSAGSAWSVTAASPPSSYPPLADCVVHKIYDQSGNSNHLLPATPAINNPAFDNPVNATRHPITIRGHKVFGAMFETGMGYRAQNTTGIARNNDPETLYMVTSGTYFNGECPDTLSNRQSPPSPATSPL
jgi:hypothetical protein